MAKTFQYKPGQDLIQATTPVFKQIDDTLQDPGFPEKIAEVLNSIVSMIQSDMIDLVSLEGKGDIMETLDELISMSQSQMALTSIGRKLVQKGSITKSDWDEIKYAVDSILNITKAWMQNAFTNKKK